MKINLRKFGIFAFLMALSLFLSTSSLMWRVRHENASRSSLILFDLLEMHALNEPDTESAFAAMMTAGISGFLVPECTGEEILKGVLEGVAIVPSAALPDDVRQKLTSSMVTVLSLRDSQSVNLQRDYLSRRFSGTEFIEGDSLTYAVLPHIWGQVEKSGIMPDLRAVSFLSSFGVPLVFAPNLGPYGNMEDLRQALEFLCSSFSGIKALCPSGEVAPDAAVMGSFVKNSGLLMCNVEFSRMFGASRLASLAWPNVVSMHGVDRAEVIKRNIGRTAMLNRFFRAAKEREVRLLVLRLDPLRNSAVTLENYCSDVRQLRERLDKEGFAHQWPQKAPEYPKFFSFLSSLGLMIMLLTLAARTVGRYFSTDYLSDARAVACLFVLAALLCVASMFVGIVLKLAGAFAAGLLATEASLMAMDRWKVPLRGAAEVLVLIICGGFTLTAAYSRPIYMYRLAMFSGVKISLLLPLVLVLLTDLKLREHPESLPEILKRPPIWGELALAGGIMLAGLIMLVRSGNYGFVGGREIAFRDWLEDVLVARPRTKEFLIGYPCLVIWYYLRRKDYWPHWREAFRLGVTLAFSSAVNSFCHFHTPLALTVLRTLNGWWIGLVLGCLLLFIGAVIVRPVARRALRLL